MDLFPWDSADSLDDDTFEELVSIHERGADPFPDPQPLDDFRPNPDDPNNFETLRVDESAVEAASRALESTPAATSDSNASSGAISLGELDTRIAYLQ